jgi:hypothetical protein
MVPLRQSPSPLQVRRLSAGSMQDFSEPDRESLPHTLPFAVLQLLSSVHIFGHSWASRHVLPAEPSGQHISPWLMSQSSSCVQSFVHEFWQ